MADFSSLLRPLGMIFPIHIVIFGDLKVKTSRVASVSKAWKSSFQEKRLKRKLKKVDEGKDAMTIYLVIIERCKVHLFQFVMSQVQTC